MEDINDKFFAFLDKGNVVEKSKQVKSNFEIKEIDKHKTNRMKNQLKLLVKHLSLIVLQRHLGISDIFNKQSQ